MYVCLDKIALRLQWPSCYRQYYLVIVIHCARTDASSVTLRKGLCYFICWQIIQHFLLLFMKPTNTTSILIYLLLFLQFSVEHLDLYKSSDCGLCCCLCSSVTLLGPYTPVQHTVTVGNWYTNMTSLCWKWFHVVTVIAGKKVHDDDDDDEVRWEQQL